MRDSVTRFLQQLRTREGFRFHVGGQVTLLSSCFALRTLHLLETLADDERDMAARIAAAQGVDGSFADPSWRVEDTTGSHAPRYQRWQTTFFALSTLDLLGVAARHPLSFLDELLEPARLREWVLGLDWKNFWYGSNELMFLLYFLAYREARRDDRAAGDAARACLELLDEVQDPETGFFVHDPTPTLANRMYGAAHIYLFYDYWQRPLRYPERVVDSTLALANSAGLFGSRHGGACEDYDGVECLLRASMGTPHRRAEVDAALAATAKSILDEPTRGGFPYRLRRGLRDPVAAVAAFVGQRRTYRYSGWDRMRAFAFAPDTWGTYFRVLAVAAVHHRAGSDRFRFYDLPAWGYGGAALGAARRTT